MAKKVKIQSAAFKRNTLTAAAIVLFALIVLSEILLAISIPWYLTREDTMAVEVQRINLRNSFDHARRISSGVSGRNEVKQAEMRLVRWSLDSMSEYLRLYTEKLSSEDLKKIQSVINAMNHTANRIHKMPYSVEQRLDTSLYLNSLLAQEKKNVKTLYDVLRCGGGSFLRGGGTEDAA